jgi:hypothetical protein
MWGKDNQPTLCEKVEAAAATAEPASIKTSENKGHNRSETPTATVFGAAPAVAGTEWQGLVSAIVMVTRTTYKRGSKTGLWSTAAANILRINKTGSFVQDRYRASLNGLEGLLALRALHSPARPPNRKPSPKAYRNLRPSEAR